MNKRLISFGIISFLVMFTLIVGVPFIQQILPSNNSQIEFNKPIPVRHFDDRKVIEQMTTDGVQRFYSMTVQLPNGNEEVILVNTKNITMFFDDHRLPSECTITVLAPDRVHVIISGNMRQACTP